MWAMVPFGILMPSIRPPHTVDEGDPKTMQIRTRRKKDLEILRDLYMGEKLGEIMHTPNMDYNYRAYSTPADFAVALAQMVLEIDYEKFKPTTESKFNDKELHSTLNAIWSNVTRLGKPYEGLKYHGTSSGKYTGKYGGSYDWIEGSEGGSWRADGTYAASYPSYTSGKWVPVTIKGIKKWAWQPTGATVPDLEDTIAYQTGDVVADEDLDARGEFIERGESGDSVWADEYDSDGYPVDEDSSIASEYPSLLAEIEALTDELEAEGATGEEIAELHDQLVAKARADAEADMADVGMDFDWHYEEGDDEWSPEFVSSHRTKKGAKKAQRAVEPVDFSG